MAEKPDNAEPGENPYRSPQAQDKPNAAGDDSYQLPKAEKSRTHLGDNSYAHGWIGIR